MAAAVAEDPEGVLGVGWIQPLNPPRAETESGEGGMVIMGMPVGETVAWPLECDKPPLEIPLVTPRPVPAELCLGAPPGTDRSTPPIPLPAKVPAPAAADPPSGIDEATLADGGATHPTSPAAAARLAARKLAVPKGPEASTSTATGTCEVWMGGPMEEPV